MCIWLVKTSAGFSAEMVITMKTATFPPQEQIFPDDCMYVLKRGSVCSENMMPMRWISAYAKRSVWNEDFLIRQDWLQSTITCRTLA